MSHRLLLLAGTHEARALAGALWDLPGISVTASLAGVTRAPHPIAATMRTGGFGGVEGLERYLRETETTTLIDATHPFAARMPWNAAAACDAAGIPRLRLARPPWKVEAGWRVVPDLAAACAALPSGARVFLATGRNGTAPFATRPDLWCLARSIEPPGPLPGHIRSLVARPPFPLASEVALFTSHRIDHLVVKNAGGRDRGKLDAAARLGVQVVCVSRPETPPGPSAETVAEARAWLKTALSA